MFMSSEPIIPPQGIYPKDIIKNKYIEIVTIVLFTEKLQMKKK